MSVPAHHWQKLLKKKQTVLCLSFPSSGLPPLPSNRRTAVLSHLLRGAPRFQLLRSACARMWAGREMGGHSWFTGPIYESSRMAVLRVFYILGFRRRIDSEKRFLGAGQGTATIFSFKCENDWSRLLTHSLHFHPWFMQVCVTHTLIKLAKPVTPSCHLTWRQERDGRHVIPTQHELVHSPLVSALYS